MQRAEAAQVHARWFTEQQPYYSEPVRTPLEAGRLLPASVYLAAQQARRLLIDEVATKMTGLDAMIAPSTPLVAPPRDVAEVTSRGVAQQTRAAPLACVLPPSQLACPVIYAPVGQHDGLPYGMQIIDRPFAETLLLRIATTCEQSCGVIALYPPGRDDQ